MVQYTTSQSNETILMEQYANDRGMVEGSGGQSPPEAETLLDFWRLMEAANLPAFWYLETQKITDICSLHDLRSFSLTFQK